MGVPVRSQPGRYWRVTTGLRKEPSFETLLAITSVAALAASMAAKAASFMPLWRSAGLIRRGRRKPRRSSAADQNIWVVNRSKCLCVLMRASSPRLCGLLQQRAQPPLLPMPSSSFGRFRTRERFLSGHSATEERRSTASFTLVTLQNFGKKSHRLAIGRRKDRECKHYHRSPKLSRRLRSSRRQHRLAVPSRRSLTLNGAGMALGRAEQAPIILAVELDRALELSVIPKTGSGRLSDGEQFLGGADPRRGRRGRVGRDLAQHIKRIDAAHIHAA
jgi:hypothetical protein